MRQLLFASWMLAAVCALGASTSAAQPAPAATPTLGACVWDRLPEQVRDDFLKAYAADPASTSAAAVLQKADSQIKAEAAICAGRSDIPPLWIAGAVGSAANQRGALAQLAGSGIDRAKLLQAWREAPAAARDCVTGNAAKVFGITGPACPDATAPRAFLSRLGIRDIASAEARQSIIYLNSMAQEAWAAALISAKPAPAL